jgi:phage head maturation protease
MEDRVPFQFDFEFQPEGKAAEGDAIAHTLEDGDLLIEGWGLNFEIDREGEAFEDSGVLQKGLEDFLANEASLCFHHEHKKVLGKVLSAEVVSGKGVRVKARVDHQPESSPLRYLYEQIKKGTLNALSFGGFFKRRTTPNGPRIYGADFTELSVTGVPVGRGVPFAVVAGKALEDIKIPTPPDHVDGEIRKSDEEQLSFLLDELGRIFDQIAKRPNSVSNQ